MDEKLSKALEFANYTRTFEDQRKAIKQKFFDSLIHYHNGGQFTVTQTLVSFISVLVEKNDSAVLVDDNDNPIKVENLSKFYSNIIDLYFQSSNEYYTKVHELKSKRSIEKLVNYE
jgi:hypothetical protein